MRFSGRPSHVVGIIEQCVSKLNGKKLGGVEVKVEMATVSDMYYAISTKIRMSNLSRKVTEQHIVNRLKKIQFIKPPKSISLRHHPTDENKMGFALIELQSLKDALRVTRKLTM